MCPVHSQLEKSGSVALWFSFIFVVSDKLQENSIIIWVKYINRIEILIGTNSIGWTIHADKSNVISPNAVTYATVVFSCSDSECIYFLPLNYLRVQT
jgi:hypothetical protein